MAADQLQDENLGRRIDVAGLDRYETFLVCMSYMVHPNDAEKRERLKAWLEARIAEKKGSLHQLSPKTISLLIEAGREGVGDDLTDAAQGGGTAGQVLIAVLALQESGVEDAGLDKAFHVISEIHRGGTDYRGTPLRLGRDTIKNNWKKYGAVAHLWAAYVSLLGQAKENGTFSDFAEWINGHKLAAVARAIQEMAAQRVLPRNTRPLLRSDTLLIEGVDAAVWRAPELQEHIHRALSSFTSRYR
ncbi:hypothetical protein [Noviherbaspirillum autotrophicum]|uniref:Uncharacterized protein n=1 Tax=Noviherbaspirillum autotrophicum TaxID=709839 RepID=A0A0C2BKY2_9BURK|nr:hypothetical protein [Noviherbaspirillum autotrophicum]KIF81875.1 hypothetical protein TSA66_15455 [Noviherbaspirillum autotrophicum]